MSQAKNKFDESIKDAEELLAQFVMETFLELWEQ